jgi:hypothetical protein
MNAPKYYVSIFGDSESQNVKGGEVRVFDNKVDLTKWLNENNASEHSNEALAGQCMIELLDGRTAIIVRGVARILRRKVFVR